MVAVDSSERFVNPIPNAARYQQYNSATLDVLCEAAYHGDINKLETLLRSGDEDNIFNGDVNTHFTDVNALHMAAMAGQENCVKLLLEAKADPHVRCVMPDGKDPKTGATAKDKAARFKHTKVVALLEQAEKNITGWALPGGRHREQPQALWRSASTLCDHKGSCADQSGIFGAGKGFAACGPSFPRPGIPVREDAARRQGSPASCRHARQGCFHPGLRPA